MKELTLKEKAKAYDEALKAAIAAHKDEDRHLKAALERIFPELKESEDEKIRKALIDYFDDANKADENPLQSYGIHTDKAIAWLEKQGEKNLTQKTSFKKGDWVVFSNNHRGIYQIEKIENYQYTLRHILGGSMPLYFCNEDLIRLWTIQDAMDGDVLVNGSNIFKFHFIIGTRVRGYCHVNTDDGRFYNDIGDTECFGLIDDVFTPATKEQRDLLFQKMKEAGYEWDAEKKELKKIEQKPAKWSEEDEKCIKLSTDIIDSALRAGFCVQLDRDRCVEWLKSFKNRVQPKPKQEWSEEDETRLTNIIIMLKEGASRHFIKDDITKAIDWLKSLKPQPKEEWSEKDKDNIQRALYYVDYYQTHEADTKEAEECFDWLKSLKPQNHWKPTEPQLVSLTIACDRKDRVGFELTQLLKELKKL